MKFLRLLEKITALARTGINYSSDLPYQQEIYQKIFELCLNYDVETTDTSPSDQWQMLIKELGVITPKVGSVVAVMRPDGAILALERSNHRWCLPCGYADIGETPEATALREVYEETGLIIEIRHFLGIATTFEDVALPFMWEAVYLAEIQSGNLQLSHEHLSAEWIKSVEQRLWHSTHQTHAKRAFAFLSNLNTNKAIKIS